MTWEFSQKYTIKTINWHSPNLWVNAAKKAILLRRELNTVVFFILIRWSGICKDCMITADNHWCGRKADDQRYLFTNYSCHRVEVRVGWSRLTNKSQRYVPRTWRHNWTRGLKQSEEAVPLSLWIIITMIDNDSRPRRIFAQPFHGGLHTGLGFKIWTC